MLMCLVKKNFATTIVEKGLSRSRDLQEISIVRKKRRFFGLYNPSMCDMAYHHVLTSFVHDHLSKYKLQRWLEMRIRFLFASKEKTLCLFL